MHYLSDGGDCVPVRPSWCSPSCPERASLPLRPTISRLAAAASPAQPARRCCAAGFTAVGLPPVPSPPSPPAIRSASPIATPFPASTLRRRAAAPGARVSGWGGLEPAQRPQHMTRHVQTAAKSELMCTAVYCLPRTERGCQSMAPAGLPIYETCDTTGACIKCDRKFGRVGDDCEACKVRARGCCSCCCCSNRGAHVSSTGADASRTGSAVPGVLRAPASPGVRGYPSPTTQRRSPSLCPGGKLRLL